MEPQDEEMGEGMGDTMAAPMSLRRPRRMREISHGRRLELQRMANAIAADVLEKTKIHERCLLRRMVENLLPEEE